MELSQLFTMQNELDAFIQRNRTEGTDVFQEKGLAFTRRTCRISK